MTYWKIHCIIPYPYHSSPCHWKPKVPNAMQIRHHHDLHPPLSPLNCLFDRSRSYFREKLWLSTLRVGHSMVDFFPRIIPDRVQRRGGREGGRGEGGLERDTEPKTEHNCLVCDVVCFARTLGTLGAERKRFTSTQISHHTFPFGIFHYPLVDTRERVLMPGVNVP